MFFLSHCENCISWDFAAVVMAMSINQVFLCYFAVVHFYLRDLRPSRWAWIKWSSSQSSFELPATAMSCSWRTVLRKSSNMESHQRNSIQQTKVEGWVTQCNRCMRSCEIAANLLMNYLNKSLKSHDPMNYSISHYYFPSQNFFFACVYITNKVWALENCEEIFVAIYSLPRILWDPLIS